MGSLLPTLQAQDLREGLTDYLATTFALTDPDARGALVDFIGDPESGMFRGPYVRLRLPYAPAAGNWRTHLDWYQGFPPYGHQAAAFERLSSKHHSRPQPTVVTTGTGSGKTEAFLLPIIDHVLRQRRDGVPAGIKALILYPMNALANDQAARLTELLSSHPELAPITAAIYTGDQTTSRTVVSPAGLITDRAIIRDTPPDILLTNYKMLDQLLLRPADAPIWRGSAQSLQYVVLDEFHTYDGAQGTDVAMLLRRLGLTLRSYLPTDTDTDTDTEPGRTTPLGRVTPVATSATLGSGGDPAAMLDFARTVFGETFPADAVIGETRLTRQEWLADRTTALDHHYSAAEPVLARAVEHLDAAVAHARETGKDTGGAVTQATLGELFVVRGQDTTPTPADLRVMSDEENVLGLLKQHPLVARLLTAATAPTALAELAQRAFPAVTTTLESRLAERFLEYVLAMLSHVRTAVGRAALGVDVHLWVRELSRIDRAVASSAAYRWADDGVAADHDEMYLPALYCRHCGRSGWGAQLAPTGSSLDVADDDVRAAHAAGSARFRALISAPAEAELGTPVEGLRWLHTEQRNLNDTAPDPEGADVLDGHVLPVLAVVGPDADDRAHDDECPACAGTDGIRFLGSAVATQLSVSLSTMFGAADVDSAEKKALMFTDSVQDAAHRAGFVQARSHTLSLRSALRSALGDAELSLDELCHQVITHAGNDPFLRYQLLAPDIVDRAEFTPFWDHAHTHPVRRSATARAKQRIQFDIDLEFGLQSRTGRTLELTGSVAAEAYLGPPGRAATLGRLALDSAEHRQYAVVAAATDETTALSRWVRGTVERIRTQGGISHEWLRRYLESDGSRYAVWGGRPRGQGMPAFPKGRAAPAFPALGAGPKPVGAGFDPITSPGSWYAQWAARCLDVAPQEGAFLARALFAVLADELVLTTTTSASGATVYALRPSSVQVSAPSDSELGAGNHLVVCDVCRAPVPGSATVIDQLDGARCLQLRCPGSLHRAPHQQNYYRALYGGTQMKRVVAREHTSLLPREARARYEQGFRRSSDDPAAPNVLVATPTLEMGIDIGDLSTVMLGSLPRSVASYVQRVGRAGRLTGNSLVLAYVRGRGEHLPKLFEPLSVIDGDVRPPATFLDAEEILARQYTAHIIDGFARDPSRPALSSAKAALGSFDEGTWMAQLIEHAERNAEHLLTTFLAQFDGVVTDDTRKTLRRWATPETSGGGGGFTEHLRSVVRQWNADLAELTNRRSMVDGQLPELERMAASPAASDEDRRALRTALGSLKLLNGQIHDITNDRWIAVLERYGVLPNYTLLDDAVTLDVGVTWIDPDTSEFNGDTISYPRGSRVALTELAPGATFYAQGLAVQIDAVDLGIGESRIAMWQLCPQCGWAGVHAAGAEPVLVTACPHCGTTAIGDVSQRMAVVEMTRVSAEVRRDEAAINDSRDDRVRERFQVIIAAEYNRDDVAQSWFVENSEFGAEYLRRLTIRWVNMGRASGHGTQRMIAGTEVTSGLFRVCASCGQLDRAAGRNNRDEHRSYCKHRAAATEDVREIALARTLTTQGVLLHLPPELEYDHFAHPSLSAAVLLGLREVIGGSPEHLDVATITDPGRRPGRHALLLHDTVPGGTGYLAEFADPHRVWEVLSAARSIVRQCPCHDEDRLACHRCLLPFAASSELDKVSRATALTALDSILAVTDSAQGTTDFADWRTTEEPPPAAPSSDESFLEKDFYASFIARLKALGAAVVETPGTYGPSATVTVPGAVTRRWTLKPQVQVGAVRPDYVLATEDSSIPEMAIFADGRRFHASAEHNLVAVDVEKRATLRDLGYLVWSFSPADLQRFKDNHSERPGWLHSDGADFVTSKFNIRPATLELLNKDPIFQLLSFIRDPDVAEWQLLSTHLPYLFLRQNQRVASSVESLAEAALKCFTDAEPFPQGGTDICWPLRFGTVVVTAGVRRAGDRRAVATLALDDADDALAQFDGRDWKEWLRLTNWFGLSGRHRIATRSQLASGAGDEAAPSAVPPQLPAQWQRLLGETVSDDEASLVRALAAIPGMPLPELGHETLGGVVLDVAWPAAHVAVMGDDDDPGDDWIRCGRDAVDITRALRESGVL